ncbi:acetoacetate--CoA ligase [Prauserella muralis]|uniref:Acetoacetate-CoA ligase n=1 Tax=Prauserella muralis TaxID=588067 RepID=A0A2V4ATD0_9PSEU|nr:acetoacetate--CoA ligase [Prauserella muralis]PXY24680.1 acetoacetate-CoA ligase [Prauserella muralis]TWE27628.1 acetoacetyl-CoA synthetase [Prauserella muralis]
MKTSVHPTGSRIAEFARFVDGRHGTDLSDYWRLWRWSIDEPGAFWNAVWDSLTGLGRHGAPAVQSTRMPVRTWYAGETLSYAAAAKTGIAAESRPDSLALIALTEDGPPTRVTRAELARQVGAFATTLRDAGVGAADRVVAYLPNGPEAVVAFLAAASVGATWSVVGQDYPGPAAIDRLAQLDPAVLITGPGYQFGGRYRDCGDDVRALVDALPQLCTVVLTGPVAGVDARTWASCVEHDAPWEPDPLSFSHPLWVLFSSGTTGLPKGIVHSHGGVTLEHLKTMALHYDLGPDDVFWWYTSPTWMVWNIQVAALLVGSTIVCYSGSPAWPTADTVWSTAAELDVTVLGTSPAYLMATERAGHRPGTDYDLRRLRVVGSTGSTLPAATSRWAATALGDMPLVSSTGGTDVVTALAGWAPGLPVTPGEISAPALGVALEAWDDNDRPVVDAVGDLVITQPMPTMPIGLWNDPNGQRYRAAYYDRRPGVWTHGDWVTCTSRGSVIVHGRSDSTLNRNGVRMGSADLYQAVERLPEIADSLVLGIELPGGGYWMPLYVVPAPETSMDDRLRERIRAVIRDYASPRHVPDEILWAPAIPRTRTGKKLEVPLKRIAQGHDAAASLELSAVDDPSALEWFIDQLTGVTSASDS